MNIPTDHIWYLPSDIDIVTCPKNGMSSVKKFYYNAHRKINDRDLDKEHTLYVPIRGGPHHLRELFVWNSSSFREYPFRQGSMRFAVKRDPVKRFRSAVEYMQRRGVLKTKRSERDYRPYKNVRALLDDLEDNKIFDIHLMPQIYFMGDRSQYHHIYDIEDMTHMFREMCRKMRIPWTSSMNPRLNVMKSPEVGRITNSLSPTDIVRIKSLYRIDYDNGWC